MKRFIFLLILLGGGLLVKGEEWNSVLTFDVTYEEGDLGNFVNIDPDGANINFRVWRTVDPATVLDYSQNRGGNEEIYYDPDLKFVMIKFGVGSFPPDKKRGDEFTIEVTITQTDGSKIVARVKRNLFSDDYYGTLDGAVGPGVDMVFDKVTDGGDPEPPAKPVIKVKPLVACAPNTVDLNSAITDNGGATIVFCNSTGGAMSGDPTKVSATGTYYVQGEKGGVKSDIVPISVTIHEKPVINLSTGPTVCKGDPFTITATGVSGSNSSYVWASSSATDIAAGNCKTGTYTNNSAIETSTYTVIGKVGECASDPKSTTVTVNPIPDMTLTANKDVVCSGDEVTLTASASLGATVVWKAPLVGSNATQKVNPLATTTYEVKAVLSGCESEFKKKTINVNPLPTINVSGGSSICKGSVLALTPSGGVSYEWTAKGTGTVASNGVLTDNPNSTGSQTYTVVGTDGKGCKATKNHSVTVNALPVPVIQVNGGNVAEVCSGTQITLTTSQSYITYKWTGSAQGNGPRVEEKPSSLSVTTRNYTVEVTDGNSCKGTVSTSVTVNPLPVVDIQGDTKACAGTPVNLKAVATGIAENNYVWSGGVSGTGSSKSLTVAAGINSPKVTVTDAKGCQGEKTHSVTGVVITPTLLTNSTLVNPGSTVTLAAGNNENLAATYVITKTSPAPEEVLAGSGNTRSVTLNETSTFKVDATTTELGCQSTTPGMCTVNVKEIELQILSESIEFCYGITDLSGLELTASATGGKKPYTYEWIEFGGVVGLEQTKYENENGGISTKITSIGSGLVGGGGYSVYIQVTDANGTIKKTQVAISVKPVPVININDETVGQTVACQGVAGIDPAITLLASSSSSGINYTWTSTATINRPNDSQQVIYPTTPTDAAGIVYKVTGKSSITGCESSATHTVIIHPKPSVTISGSESITDLCAGSTISLKATGSGGGGDFSYKWSSSETGEQVSLAVAKGTNKYKVTVTDKNNCKAVSSEKEVVGHDIDLTMPAGKTVAHGESVTLKPSTITAYPTTDVVSYEWQPTYLIAGGNNLNTIQSIGLTEASNKFTLKVKSVYCEKNGEVTIGVSGGALAANPSAENVCYGNAVNLLANAEGGSGNYSYLWTSKTSGYTFPIGAQAQKNPSLSGLEPGIYSFEVTVTDNTTSVAVTKGVSATVYALPVITSIALADAAKTDYCVGNEISFKTEVPGGSNYDYAWSAGGGSAKDAKFTPTAAGLDIVYVLTVTDRMTTCTSTKSTPKITVHSVEIVSVSATPSTILSGGSVNLTGSVQYKPSSDLAGVRTYSWTDASLVENPDQLNTGSKALTQDGQTFTLTVTDAHRCSDSETTSPIKVTGSTLVVTPAASANDGSGLLCAGKPINLLAGVEGGSGEFNYAWSSGSLNLVAWNSTEKNPVITDVLPAGNYKVDLEVTDRKTNNKVSGSVEFTIDPMPKISSITALADVCAGDNVTITATCTDAASYTWTGISPDPGVANPTVQVAEGENTYRLTAKSAQGCSASGEVKVTGYSVKVTAGVTGGVTSVVSGSEVALEGKVVCKPDGKVNNVSYLWKPTDQIKPAEVNNLNATTIGLEGKDPFDFRLQVTADYCGIIVSDPVRVTVIGEALAANPTSAPNEGSVFCAGIAVKLGAGASGGSGNLSYVWSSSSPGLTAWSSTVEQPVIAGNSLSAGVYVVNVKVTDNQTHKEVSGSTTFTVHPLPEISSITALTDVCAGDNVTITATCTDAASYTWTGISPDPGVANPTVQVAEGENTYRLTIQSDQGCSASDEVKVTGHTVTVTAKVSDGVASVVEGTEVALSGLVTCKPEGKGGTLTYAWEPADQIKTGASSENATTIGLRGKDKFDFTFKVTDNYCGTTSSTPVSVTVIPQGSISVVASDVNVCQVASGSPVYAELNATVVPEGTNAKYSWKGIVSPGTSAQTVVSPNASKTQVNIAGLAPNEYWFEVTVTDNTDASLTAKDTAVLVVKAAPKINKFEQVSECEQPKLKVTATGATNYAWGTITSPATVSFFQGATKEEQTLSWEGGNVDGTFKVYVVAKNADGCKDSATIDVDYVKLGLSAEWTDPKDICASLPVDLKLNCATSLPGAYTLDYEYTPMGGTVQKKKQAISLPGANIVLNATAAGTYKLVSIAANAHPACPFAIAEDKATVQISANPVVKIQDADCRALHQDDDFVVNVENPDASLAYSWQESVYDGTTKDWTAGSTVSGDRVNGTVRSKDVRYIVTATDNSALRCQSTDTVLIYRIPDAPVLSIDKESGSDAIKLSWNKVGDADGYTVWSRKWDPYCLTSVYSGDLLYEAEVTGRHIDALTWTERAMDTLEFYYVTADRSVCESVYNSHSSADTVGYHLQKLQSNSNANLNLVSYIFDMSSKGIRTSEDMAGMLKVRPTSMQYWDYATQKWVSSDYYEMFGFWQDPFAVSKHHIYMINLDPSDPGESLLFYGKLEDAVFAFGRAINAAYVPLRKSYCKMTDTDVAPEIPSMTSIQYWNFASQKWVPSDFYAMFGYWDSPFGVYPTMPLVLVLDAADTWPK